VKTLKIILIIVWSLIVVIQVSFVFVSAKSFVYRLTQMDRDQRDRAITLQLRQVGLPYDFLNAKQVDYMLDIYFKESSASLTSYDKMIFYLVGHPIYRPSSVAVTLLTMLILGYSYLREGWEIDRSRQRANEQS